VLPARAAGAHRVDAQVGRIDVELDLLGLGQHRHRRGRGVDAALRLGLRHALHAVAAGLEAQLAPRAFALDREHDLLEAADLARRRLEHLGPPVLRIEVVLVDAPQIAREQRCFVAAGAGADLHDHLAPVVVLLADQRVDHRFVELGALARDGFEFLLGGCVHLGIGEQVLGVSAALFERLHAPQQCDLGLERAALAHDRADAPAVGDHLLRRQELGQFLVTLARFTQLDQDRVGEGHRGPFRFERSARARTRETHQACGAAAGAAAAAGAPATGLAPELDP
jgi:hypothetical protein